MKEYNELTKRLLAEGYTAKNYPDYVRIPSGQLSSGDALHNLYGGFEYKRIICDEFVYKTPCGFYVYGRNCLGGLSSGGVEYCHENNNVLIMCPYRKKDCQMNPAKLYDAWCQCSKTDDPYDYEKSIEKIRKQAQERMEQKWKEFVESRKGVACRVHAKYDVTTEEWSMHYDPEQCRLYCPNQYVKCSILNKQLSRKKGNVFYDLKKTYVPKQNENQQYSFFDKSEVVYIEKGKRYFNKPMPIDICEAVVKLENGRILRKWKLNNGNEFFWNNTLQVEVLNIRAEVRESRDLMQDLKDIQEGIEVVHESDNIARKKEMKAERRVKAQESKVRSLIKKISSIGWDNLEENERIKAKKTLDTSEIREADETFKKSQKKTENKQMTLWEV